MNSRHFSCAALLAALACVPETVGAQPQSSLKEFVPFQSFLDKTRGAKLVDFAGPDAQVKDEASLEEMRQHILTLYGGVQVSHSFVLNSSHFDCIPVEQQPGVKAQNLKTIAPAPPQSIIAKPAGTDGAADRASPASQFDPEKKTDDFGNSASCEQNTIPMRRITLEEMTHFPTLRDFFQKGPGGSGRPSLAVPRNAPESSPTQGHKYSIMTQEVNNLGGNSNLNLWNPYVNTAWGEVFSLSQEWYVGGSGEDTQTAEVGWQNFPAKYGNEDSRLFIYWTADYYNQTGCYNLECGAFVQVSNAAPLGGGFTAYSTHGGGQYEVSAMYYLYQGNWWLAIQGKWIGYYPGSIYRGGQLSRYSQNIQFGTEGVGVTVWPAEGSGNWSTSGFGSAAYQRNLYYINLSRQWVWDSLRNYDPSPHCYSTSGPFFSTSSDWGANFYEGGPGGPGC
jgi:hypothetical protein